MPDQKKIRRDTLLLGDFRPSAIDSIKDLIIPIKDSVIYNSNAAILSGTASSIQIITDEQNIVFDLHNASDTTAEKIVDILNSHIPVKYEKLHISQAIRRKKNAPTSTTSY